MTVIAMISQQGGSGKKTTLALALAVAHEEAGGAAVVADLGSPRVSARLAPLSLCGAAPGRGRTPILSSSTPRAMRPSALVPCRPSTPDLAAIGASLEVAHLANAPLAVVFNGVPARGSLAAEAAEAVQGTGARSL